MSISCGCSKGVYYGLWVRLGKALALESTWDMMQRGNHDFAVGVKFAEPLARRHMSLMRSSLVSPLLISGITKSNFQFIWLLLLLPLPLQLHLTSFHPQNSDSVLPLRSTPAVSFTLSFIPRRGIQPGFISNCSRSPSSQQPSSVPDKRYGFGTGYGLFHTKSGNTVITGGDSSFRSKRFVVGLCDSARRKWVSV